MKTFEMEPLQEELEVLLNAERAPIAPPADVQARLFARLESTLFGPGSDGGGGSEEGGGSQSSDGSPGDMGPGEMPPDLSGAAEIGLSSAAASTGAGAVSLGTAAATGSGTAAVAAASTASTATAVGGAAAAGGATGAAVATGGAVTAGAAAVSWGTIAVAKLAVGVGIASFAAGGAVGVGIQSTLATPPSPPTVKIARERPAPSEANTNVPSVAAEPLPLAEPAAEAVTTAAPGPSTARSAHPDAPTGAAAAAGVGAGAGVAPTVSVGTKQPKDARPSVRSPDEALRAERSYLEQARTALGRRDAAAALQALEQHRAKFATGRLSEERDALMVHALTALGRSAEATRSAAAFRRRYPQSLLMPAVDAALDASK